MLKIAMLSTGEEVLHGDIVDTNAAWLSQRFFEHGFSVTKRSTVGDEMSALVEELMMLSFNSDVVVVNGGLGPTSDDLSAEAVAVASETELVLYPEWLARLEKFFTSRGLAMPESNRKQAMLPKDSVLLDNPIGTACGFKVRFNDCDFYFTPGVPSEFKLMVEQQILPDMKATHSNVLGQECSKLYTFGTSESALSDKLDKVQLPDGYTLGYRSYLPYIEVKLFGPKNDLDNRVKLLQIIFNLIESNVVSVDESMQDHVAYLIQERKQSIATAEQSTYGSLSHWLQSKEVAAEYCGHGWVLGERVNVGDENDDQLAAAFALAGATKDKCATDIAIVTAKVIDKTFSVALAAPEGEWGQTLTFNRNYTREERTLVITTVAADMLRRYLNAKPMFVQYSSLSRNKEMFVPRSAIEA
ncbi:CinA family nicotinamide mononucleotide deamidase-related protein [Vibrio tubiashii]|uniref:CinA-like protein n=1 Tax=Vibrio tubiashii TaxID=29498 RepID=A0AAE5GTC1_9VIBR|nr:CinA family nicotinamide mononucleotide deamidase-related protein [Vibrio tubiashii]MCG9582419.1 CinA family nicotinamide mononucleotide deamidase-related protein [Vibrio tubiashii]MCG9616010.1 CinA family nicotinamide mononucleotide deamidase-related protein [Vibrio tubiashii]MCG9687888.1 CinA family nicotinamide mononucleotide deamidase-related protein [Vibrio tubiashii]NOI82797.1 CinA family nicotinamide mononucleotide deamidase-related protein [Vibrio tubiashii]